VPYIALPGFLPGHRLAAFAADLPAPEPAPAAAGEEFVVPSDLTPLSAEEVSALHAQAIEHFDALYGDGQGFSEEDLASLMALTEAIETLTAEVSRRDAVEKERAEQAAALASRIRPAEEAPAEDDTAAPAAAPAPEAEVLAAAPAAAPAPTVPETMTAAASRGVRVSLSNVRSRQAATARTAPALRAASEATSMREVVLAAADLPGFTPGQGMDWNDIGRAVDRRLQGFNATAYANATATKRHLREQHSVAILRKPIQADLTVTSTDPEHVSEVLRRASDESRLKGGSLVASGGWCAPSEVLYDLCELESRDGLFSLPEIGVSRGGIKWTTGPLFQDLYAAGFGPYTEANDIAGEYGGPQGGPHAVGDKPCFTVPCPTFQEARLELIGLCISAGLLQARGYPEMIARVVRGSLVAHDHRMSSIALARVEAGSTAVTMTADQAGATAPLLDAIELQVEHYRYTHRLSRTTTLEAVFPYWVRGVVRSDLARRIGTTVFEVSNAQIDAWFALRGIAPQYVYDWQPLTGAAGSFKAWPGTVKFLLYTAGTWVKGTSDVITLDTLYDSTMLAQNDYTALFTEEGFLLAKVCADSRVVTVGLCPSGATNGGVDIGCDGVEVAQTGP
jgi:hypothetical protein